MADSRPTKPVLQSPRTTAPVKVPPGEGTSKLPRGGPRIPRGLPGLPGDPKAAGQGSGGPASRANFVDGGAVPVTSYDNPQTKGYETAVGQGPTEDLRPAINVTPPPNLNPPVGHGAKPA